jgi:hypothetical protein
MPAEKRRRLDEEGPPSRFRQHLVERRQQGTIDRPQTRPADLTAQHLQLMPQHENLDLSRPLRTTKENEKLEQTADHPGNEGQAPKQQTSTDPITLSHSRHPEAAPYPPAGGPPEAAREFLGPTGPNALVKSPANTQSAMRFCIRSQNENDSEPCEASLARVRTAACLSAWAELVQGGIGEEGFVASVRSELTGSDPELRGLRARGSALAV